MEANDLFIKYGLEPFNRLYGKNGFTPFKPAFYGLRTILEIEMYLKGIINTFDNKDSLMEWALNKDNLQMNFMPENSQANFGRGSMATHAEICYKLSAMTEDPMEKRN